MTATPDTIANTGAVSERIPCFGGPMDGQVVETAGIVRTLFPTQRASDDECYTRCKFYRTVELENGNVRYQLGCAFIWHADVTADYRLTMDQDSKVEWSPSLSQIMQEELEGKP